ncbi:MAG: WhiB family transcriptional regulator [Candidatus Saccharimonadales bacterium]
MENIKYQQLSQGEEVKVFPSELAVARFLGAVIGTGDIDRFKKFIRVDREAKCRDGDPEAFFPDKGGETKYAKEMCGECPVREDCLDLAMEGGEEFGVWGDLSPKERKKLTKTENNQEEDGLKQAS